MKLKSQLMDAMDANRTLSSTTAELTHEKKFLTNDIARMGIEMSVKDEELKRTKESHMKALDQLKVLSD